MMTQKQFETELTNFRKEISTWGKDAQDVHSFIHRTMMRLHNLREDIWVNGFVAHMILNEFENMRKTKEFEPHLTSAWDYSQRLLVEIPVIDLMHVTRSDTVNWLRLSEGKTTNETPL